MPHTKNILKRGGGSTPEKKNWKDIAQHRASKAIRAKAVSFASSCLFADQIHSLSHSKVKPLSLPYAPSGGVFHTGNKSTLTLLMLFYPSCPLSSHFAHVPFAPHHVLRTSLGTRWPQATLASAYAGDPLAKAPTQPPCHHIPFQPVSSQQGRDLMLASKW